MGYVLLSWTSEVDFIFPNDETGASAGGYETIDTAVGPQGQALLHYTLTLFQYCILRSPLKGKEGCSCILEGAVRNRVSDKFYKPAM